MTRHIEGPFLPPHAAISREDFRARFILLYRKEKPRLLRFFLRRLRNQADADEMAQEVLARYFKAASNLEVATPEAYLTRIATNMLRDRAELGATRLALRSVPLDEALLLTDQIDPYREASAREDVARWESLLRGLPRETVDIFLLNRLEGYSYREIGFNKRLPLWIVQKQMLKAMRFVAANLEADDE
ncbi:RNA polymerase sigma-70 factor, ECF subfamily [Sphingobium sp. AP50]|uniref:RNA polymerase sigma factor n=1 Tax=Sphingobium sp. AP50 TaxID=1884369 RepID=UPI0008D44336|nr:sigma-70 family RNA polymerase sigma factor [Sphingobium sp. AP50]SEK05530.1 RNA polymerase sigma-70 factor, ECF subfamily [Sphingobium sp. AP50]